MPPKASDISKRGLREAAKPKIAMLLVPGFDSCHVLCCNNTKYITEGARAAEYGGKKIADFVTSMFEGEDLNLSKHESLSREMAKAVYIIEVERGPRDRREYRYFIESVFNSNNAGDEKADEIEEAKTSEDLKPKEEFLQLEGTGVKYVEIHVKGCFPVNPYGLKRSQVYMDFGCEVHKKKVKEGHWRKSIALYPATTHMSNTTVPRPVTGEWLKGGPGPYGIETWEVMDTAILIVMKELMDNTVEWAEYLLYDPLAELLRGAREGIKEIVEEELLKDGVFTEGDKKHAENGMINSLWPWVRSWRLVDEIFEL